MPITLIYNNETFEISLDAKIVCESIVTSLDPHIKKMPLTLAQCIFWSNCIPARPLCAGIASCGRCKVRFVSKAPEITPTEKKILTQEEQNNSVRLSCRHMAEDGMIIELFQDKSSGTSKNAIKQEQVQREKQEHLQIHPEEIATKPSEEKKQTLSKKQSQKNLYRLFVDIGTTSIAWQAEPMPADSTPADTVIGQSIATTPITQETDIHSSFETTSSHSLEINNVFSGGALNPQMVAGADVMARLHMAKNRLSATQNPRLLEEVVQSYLRSIVEQLANNNCHIQEIFVAANPSIMALSLGTDISGLCSAPYVLADYGDRYATINDLPPIWVAPQISAFIGADACCGLAYILTNNTYISTIQSFSQTKNTADCDKESDNHMISFLLADMGTNGEFIVYHETPNSHEQKIIAASVPLGPAIEGVGMRFGAPVHGDMEGIILSFSLGMRGLEYNCQGTPKHICGAAYLSLLHILLSQNILDRQGFFQILAENMEEKMCTPLTKKIAKNIRIENDETRLYITDEIYICSEDIENILKVKSAFATAIELLTKEIKPNTIYLSGSLADYIPLTHLENLGFIPQGAVKYTKILGNSSLKGLIALANNTKLKKELSHVLKKAITLDLTADPIFAERFIENMHF